MSLAVAAIAFGLVFVAELPDKTMIATIVMASRYRALPVWTGASAAFTFHAALAVAAGRALALLPHRAVELVVAVLFAAGAVYLLVTQETSAEHEGEREAARLASHRRIALSAFSVIAVGEFGDLTQILIANLTAHYTDPWAVFTGSAAALVAVCGVGVAGGRALVRVLPLAVIRRLAGVVLIGFTGWAAFQAAH